ncbi:MAG: SMP-30/gluconolactonase/LRE family protein [Halioglobus sp.]|nr:SMP-30/gluconolactonase/LRE family protein [Halioglobus sp.]
MLFSLQRLTFSCIFLSITACGHVEYSCDPHGDVIPICGVQMPEDLAPLPDNGGILISEYGDGGKIPGALAWFQPAEGYAFTRLVDSSNMTEGAGEKNWGDADCPLPDQLSPHGIHLSQRGDSLQLLVVNHSSREHILFYEVQSSAGNKTAPTLFWRGCVALPEHAVINDVVALPDGGFAVTHMYNRENQTLAQIKSLLGLNNGHVWRWSPGSGIRVMANTSARMPNGIEVSPDGKTIWVNNYIEQELRQYDLVTEQLLATISVPNIDNSAWLGDGRLLLASHTSPLTMVSCFGLTKGSCGSPYELVAADTEAGTTEVLFRAEQGGPFGPATVAIEYQGKLYAGSFSGDRLAEIPLQHR